MFNLMPSFVSRDAPARHGAGIAVTQVVAMRGLLLLGCALAVAAAALAGAPAAFIAADPDLARLLRGMALIKAVLISGAVAVLWWRLGHPLSRRFAAVYLLGAWAGAGASMLVWQLTVLPMAVVVFHAGEIAMVLAAWRDRHAFVRRGAS